MDATNSSSDHRPFYSIQEGFRTLVHNYNTLHKLLPQATLPYSGEVGIIVWQSTNNAYHSKLEMFPQHLYLQHIPSIRAFQYCALFPSPPTTPPVIPLITAGACNADPGFMGTKDGSIHGICPGTSVVCGG